MLTLPNPVPLAPSKVVTVVNGGEKDHLKFTLQDWSGAPTSQFPENMFPETRSTAACSTNADGNATIEATGGLPIVPAIEIVTDADCMFADVHHVQFEGFNICEHSTVLDAPCSRRVMLTDIL